MYRFLLSRQWVILTLIALLLIPTMIRLGFWQMDRYDERDARNQRVTKALKAEPAPVQKLTSPGHKVTTGQRYRTVTAVGEFDADREVVVRRRVNAGEEVGFHVLTPFVLNDGKVLLVNRGWIPADGPSQAAFPKIPAPPAGRVTVTGRLMPDETTEASGIKDLKGLPDRQVMLIDSARESRRLDAPVLGGYVVQTAPEPRSGTPQLIGSPGEENAPLNYAYALQWWLFAVGIPIGWVILARREARERGAAGAAEPERDRAEPAAV